MVLVEHLDYVEDVYDFTVEDTHCFFADDILVHNCGEILLGDKSFCNLVTVDLGKFNGKFKYLQRVLWIIGRANYRQTCVDLRDGILQHTWHELNEFLRLTGVSCMGIVKWEHHKSKKHIAQLHEWAREAVDSMADELNLPRSKACTTIKPEGCLDEDTLIKTDRGLMTMREIFLVNDYFPETSQLGFLSPKEFIQVYDENNELQPITALFNNGWKEDPIKVVFENGTSVVCTKDHKFKTSNRGWVEAQDLTEEDDIIQY